MKKKTSTIFFAIVTVTALFAVAFIMAPQPASAEHHKAHIFFEDSSGSKKLPKTVIGGMIVDGY